MITAACPHPQTVRARLVSYIPEQSTSSPEHAGALPGTRHAAVIPGVVMAGIMLGDQHPVITHL